MKKRKILYLLPIASLALSSCSFKDVKNWFLKLFGKAPAEEQQPSEELTIDNVVNAFTKMSELTSYTSSTEMTYKGNDTFYISGKNVPAYDDTVMRYLTEVVGKDSKTDMKYETTSVVKFADAATLLGISKEETINEFIKLRNQYLSYGYERTYTFDFAKEEVQIYSPLVSQVTYTLYDQEADQTFDYTEGETTKYNTENSDLGIINTADIVEIVKKGRIEGDSVITEIDGTEISIKIKLDNGYISSLEADIQQGVHIKISYSKFNETSFEIPSQVTKPVCHWAHDSHTPYHYFQGKNGHKKYCQECYKFLGSEEQHVTSHNDKGVCEKCGYVLGEDDVDEKTIPGFEKTNGQGDYYVEAKIVNDVFCNSPNRNYHDDYSCYESGDSTFAYADYLVYLDDNAVLKVTRGIESKVNGACMEKQAVTFDLYRNLSNETLSTIKNIDSDKAVALKAYLADKQISATFTGYEFNRSHNYEHISTEEIVIDECHTIENRVCSDCNEIVSGYINTNHKQDLVTSTQLIDSCHTLICSDCPVCHEHHEEVQTNHVSGDPIIKEEAIDSCYTLLIGSCATCGEEIGRMVEAHHNGTTTTKEIVVDSCTTRTLTICNDCHSIIDDTSVSNHQHTQSIICDYETLETYEFADSMGYHSINSVYEFEYCSDCHKPVNGEVKEYSYVQLNHPYNDSYYTVHHITDSGDNTTYESDTFDHALDENGFCKYCHAKVLDLGDSSIGFIAYYNCEYSYWDTYQFFNKTTGETMSLYDFNNDPSTGTDSIGSYNEFKNSSYPGIAVREYLEDYQPTCFVVKYNNLETSVTISPSDFAH